MRETDEGDSSASTAQFRAFVDSSGGPDTTQQWAMHAPRRQRGGLVIAIVIAVVILVAIGVLVFH